MVGFFGHAAGAAGHTHHIAVREPGVTGARGRPRGRAKLGGSGACFGTGLTVTRVFGSCRLSGGSTLHRVPLDVGPPGQIARGFFGETNSARKGATMAGPSSALRTARGAPQALTGDTPLVNAGPHRTRPPALRLPSVAPCPQFGADATCRTGATPGLSPRGMSVAHHARVRVMCAGRARLLKFGATPLRDAQGRTDVNRSQRR